MKIQRGSGTVQAQLVQLLTEGTASPNPRWLIRYLSGSRDDEVYEHSFLGKVGLNNEETSTSQLTEHNLVDEDSPAVFDQQQLNESSMENSRAKKKRKAENTNDMEPVANSDSSIGRKGTAKVSRSSNKNTALSTTTREVRSRRRGQSSPDTELYEEKHDGTARIDEGLSLTGENSVTSSQQLLLQQQRKRKLTGAAKLSVETKRERESKTDKKSTNASSQATSAKQQQQLQPKEQEECVKIKFLTGMLYLYRGKRRRAEFVRRV